MEKQTNPAGVRRLLRTEVRAPVLPRCSRAEMPLLTELEKNVVGSRFYNDAAPNGAAARALRITRHAPRFNGSAIQRFNALRAFTLIELLVVIAIIGILAAVVLPNLHSLKPNPAAVAVNQLRDDIGRARQLAIANHTTIYMIFAPSNFFSDVSYNPPTWTATNRIQAANLFDKQLIGYTFVSLRRVGDQPGAGMAHYYSAWRTLPDGAYIPLEKFLPFNPNANGATMKIYTNGNPSVPAFQIFGFNTTNNIPFPSEDTPAAPTGTGQPPYVTVPYLAFNYLGQLTSPVAFNQATELIPVARGSVIFRRDLNTKVPLANVPNIQETPPGNATASYNLVSIDPLTGRAHVEQPRIQ